MKEENKKIIAGASGACLLGAVVAGAITSNIVSDSELVAEQSQVIESISTELAQISEINEISEIQIQELSNKLNEVGLELIQFKNQSDTDKEIIADMESQIVELNKVLERYNEEIVAPVQPVYVSNALDGIQLSGSVTGVFDNYDFSTLFDQDIEYDGDAYRVFETIELKPGIEIDRSRDYESDIVFTFDRGNSVAYNVEFEKGIKLKDGEELKIPFLDETLRIKDIGSDRITLSLASEYFVEVGKVLEIDGKTVSVIGISDEQALFEIDGVKAAIRETNTNTVNGIKIEVTTVFNSNIGNSFVVFNAGDKLETTIKEGDDYESDKRFKWTFDIDNGVINSIGLNHYERLNRESEVLNVGEEFSLPDNFAQFVIEPEKEYNYYDFSVKAYNGEIDIKFDNSAVVYVNGSREDITDITVDSNGNVEIDNVVYNIEDVKFKIGRRNFEFEQDGSYIKLVSDGDVVKFSENSGELVIENLMSKENDYRTVFGDVVVGDIKRNAENGKLEVKLINEQYKLKLNFK